VVPNILLEESCRLECGIYACVWRQYIAWYNAANCWHLFKVVAPSKKLHSIIWMCGDLLSSTINHVMRIEPQYALLSLLQWFLLRNTMTDMFPDFTAINWSASGDRSSPPSTKSPIQSENHIITLQSHISCSPPQTLYTHILTVVLPMSVNSDSTDFKYTCKESEITSNYEWLYQTEVSFRANVKLW